MARGDRVRVLVDVGGATQEFVVEANAAGRSVEVVPPRNGMVEVRLVGRTGKVVLTDRFMSSRVVALVEERAEADDEVARHNGQLSLGPE
jgi:hypothetical protein